MEFISGQVSTATGWFVDRHGHRMFIQRGDRVPVCPHVLPTPVRWTLVRIVDDHRLR